MATKRPLSTQKLLIKYRKAYAPSKMYSKLVKVENLEADGYTKIDGL